MGHVGEVVDVRRERFFFVNREVLDHFDPFYMMCGNPCGGAGA